jgi:hypothetical protein
MRHKTAKLLTTALGFSLFVTAISANPGQVNPPTQLGIADIIQAVLRLLPPLIVILFLAMLVYGGFIRMTAAGDADKEKLSNQIITAAVVGFVIIVIAPFLINVLSTLLGLGNLITP